MLADDTEPMQTMAVENNEPTIGARNHTNPPSAARGGFDGIVYEALEQALSQSEGQSARPNAGDESKSYEQSLQDLIRLQEDLKKWTSPPILINVAESLTSDVVVQIDIVETLLGSGGRKCRNQRRGTMTTAIGLPKSLTRIRTNFVRKKLYQKLRLHAVQEDLRLIASTENWRTAMVALKSSVAEEPFIRKRRI